MAQRRRSGYDEDWQRRKAELIRGFFAEPPLLSPVPEEEESFTTSASPPTLQAPVPRPHDPGESGGRYSSLPPLIVEIVLKPNKHDDPPELYAQLEKRVMKAYRRLFIEGYSDISELSDSDNSDSNQVQDVGERVETTSFGRETEPTETVQELIRQTSFDDATQTFERDKDSLEDTEPEMDEDLSLGDERIRTKDRLSESDKETLVVEEMGPSSSTEILPQSTSDEVDDFEESKLSSTIPHENSSTLMEEEIVNEDGGKTSLSSADISYTQITFQADVHRDAIVEEVIDYEEENVEQEQSPKAIIEEMNDEVEESRVPAIDINTTADVEEPREIEVMRTARIHASAGSVQNEAHDESHGETFVVEHRSRSLEAQPETDLVEGESAHNVVMESEESIDYDVLRTSSPVHEQNENVAPENVSPDKRKSSEVSATTPRKRKRRQEDTGIQTPQDEGTQTHFDEEDVNMRILRDIHFFSGVMGVYRLCACANHLCSRGSR